MPTVTVIPPKMQVFAGNVVCANQLRRVAGYARVSTDSDEQFTSFEAQVDYYTKKIQENPEWTFVKVFTDVDSPYGLNPKARECLIMMARTGFFVFYRRGLFDNPQMCWEHFINLLWRKELLLFGFEGFLCD